MRETMEVIARVAQERRAPLLQVGSDVEYELIDWGLWGTKLNYCGRLWREKGLTMGLAGPTRRSMERRP